MTRLRYDLDRSVGRANDEAYGSDLTGLRPETDNNNTVSSRTATATTMKNEGKKGRRREQRGFKLGG
eukprot:scaffold20116_cov69-Cyclotella_meneghiniana.AAC.6